MTNDTGRVSRLTGAVENIKEKKRLFLNEEGQLDGEYWPKGLAVDLLSV